MLRLQILRCVPDGSDPGRVIDAVVCDGLIARMDKAIALALTGAVEFFTVHEGQRTPVTVAKSPTDRLYLKTKPNTSISDNLGTICRPAKPAPAPPPGSRGQNYLKAARIPGGFTTATDILTGKKKA